MGGVNACAIENYGCLKPWDSVAEFVSQVLLTTYTYTCGKLNKLSIIKDNNIRFREDKRFGEDCLFNNEILKHSSEVSALPVVVYQYNMIAGSVSRLFYDEEVIDTLEEIREFRMDFFIRQNGMIEVEKTINRDAAFNYLFAMYSIYRNKGVKNKYSWLKRYWESAKKGDQEWSYQLDSGMPKITAIIGRKSKFLCHIWLSIVFGAEKIKNKLRR